MNGDPTCKMPASIARHGEVLTGVAPATPGVLGLPPDYIARGSVPSAATRGIPYPPTAWLMNHQLS